LYICFTADRTDELKRLTMKQNKDKWLTQKWLYQGPRCGPKANSDRQWTKHIHPTLHKT